MEMNDIIMQPFYQFIQEVQVLLEIPQYVVNYYNKLMKLRVANEVN